MVVLLLFSSIFSPSRVLTDSGTHGLSATGQVRTGLVRLQDREKTRFVTFRTPDSFLAHLLWKGDTLGSVLRVASGAQLAEGPAAVRPETGVVG